MIEIKNLSKTFSGTGDTVEALKKYLHHDC